MQPASFIIITGLSGSGKGTFLRALEDRGFFCVDNLPLGLLPKFYELIVKSEGESSKAAMVIDVREGQTLSEFPAVYEELKKNSALEMSLWFLEASETVLVRRFSETRRPHPLDPNRPVLEAIALERERLAPIRTMADYILDTSQFTIHELGSMRCVCSRKSRFSIFSYRWSASGSNTASRSTRISFSTSVSCRIRTLYRT